MYRVEFTYGTGNVEHSLVLAKCSADAIRSARDLAYGQGKGVIFIRAAIYLGESNG